MTGERRPTQRAQDPDWGRKPSRYVVASPDWGRTP
jgi:hypothetical protein